MSYERWNWPFSVYLSPASHKGRVPVVASSTNAPDEQLDSSYPEQPLLLPSQKEEGQPFYSTDWEGSAEKCIGECNLYLLRSQLASTSQLWPGNLHTGFGEVDDQGMGGGGDLAKGAHNQPLHLSNRRQLPLQFFIVIM